MSKGFSVASRRVVTSRGLVPATVIVEGECIHALEAGVASSARDLGDLVIQPALVDVHVHINEPGRTAWEGFETATRAAAKGGIATIVDMPLNSDPVTTSLAALHAKLASAPGKLWVDVGFWGGVVPGNAGELAAMADAGVFGFKCFTCHSGIDDFPASSEADLRVAMPVLRDAGVPLLVHAELELPLREAATGDAADYLTYLHSRPREWEDAAIAMVIRLVRETGCRAHIVHLSSATALPMIRAAKAEGLPLTVETCPHYLCLTAEEVPRGATAFKCAPPIREADNREALWGGLLDGTIDFVISDHSPCIPSLKRPDTGDFLEAWGGIASLQLGLPSLWTEGSARGASLADLVRWTSAGPAAFLGVERGLVPGTRADLVAWSPESSFRVRADELLQRHPITPYLGREVTGEVRHTWVRGHHVLCDGAPHEGPMGRPLLRGSS